MRTGRGSLWLTAAGSVLLFVGILAGMVNHEVLDGPRFAAHVDELRRDPAVANTVGQAITGRLLEADPDLVAVRPLVESAASSLVASPAFGPLVQASARKLHQAFTDENPDQVAFRLTDVGAVLAAVLPTISPQAAAKVPAGLDVTLAQIGQRSFADRTLRLTRIVGTLAWLLPGLAILAFAAGLGLSRDRLRATVRTGWAVAVAGTGVGVVALIGAVVASSTDDATLRGALVSAAWREFGRPLWWAATIMIGAGGLLVAVFAGRVRRLDLAAELRRGWSLLTRRPDRRWAQGARGAAFALVGFGALLRPGLVFGVLGGLTGVLLLIVGAGEVSAAAGSRPLRVRAGSGLSRWVEVVMAGAALALVAGLVAVHAAPATQQVSAQVSDTTACNGHVELCARPYNDVAFPATHNGMSAADEPGWFLPEQPTGPIGQLDAGIRALLIDTWYGQSTQSPGSVATAPGSYASALAKAESLYGPDVVASALRLRNALTPTPTGPIRPYLCHGLCEIGATDWAPVMVQMRAWLDAHPREVVTLFIEDSVSPADTAAVFQQAGLLPYVHTQQPGQPWPTLGEMIDSGRRVVVLMERHGGGSDYPWLLQGFDWVQDTSYTNPTVADLSCTLNRGSASHPLFLVNNWLSNFRSLVTDARTVNAYDTLSPYLSRCRQERGHIPNYVAVNYFNEGELFRAVDHLNGLP